MADGWSVYPSFVPEGDKIISKTYMTRVEGENTRLRHYLARLHRKTLCYSRIGGDAETLYSIGDPLSQVLGYSCPCLIHPQTQQEIVLALLLLP